MKYLNLVIKNAILFGIEKSRALFVSYKVKNNWLTQCMNGCNGAYSLFDTASIVRLCFALLRVERNKTKEQSNERLMHCVSIINYIRDCTFINIIFEHWSKVQCELY